MGVHNKEITNILSFRNYEQGKKNNKILIFSNLDFFKTDKVVIKHDKIKKYFIFKKPSISYVGKTYKVLQTCNMSRIQIIFDDPMIGEFPIDEEESNEDQIVMYY